MASHHVHSAEIVPFPLNDFGGVRYLSPADITRITRDPDMLEVHPLTADEVRDLAYFSRRDRWQKRVGLACIALAIFSMIYFAFQIARGL